MNGLKIIRQSLIFLMLTFGMPAHALADDTGFRIMRAELPLRQGQHQLDVDIDYGFSNAVIDALDHGVPLTLVIKLDVVREKAWPWDAYVLQERKNFEIRFYSLTKNYQLTLLDTGDKRSFVSLNSLVRQMSKLSIVLEKAGRLIHGEHYQARVAVTLDIEALPLPLRPIAYFSPVWYLSSPWYTWTFEG
jgi:hypothetical protein